jgi:HSP20 family protein
MRLPVRRNRQQERGEEYSITPVQNTLDQFFADSLWNWNPWDMMRLPAGQAGMPRMMTNRAGWMPKVDMSETDKEIHLKINAPGVDPKHINISVDDHVLTITGRTEEKREEKGENFYRMEREAGSFQRSLELPVGADTDKIEATSDKGVINITIPKKPEAQRKPINVKVQEK